MLKSEQRLNAPLPEQVAFWNHWNAEAREASVGFTSREQADVIVSWLARAGRTDLDIIDVGCGAGWLCPKLAPFGSVTGTDLSHEVLARAAARAPGVKFVAGDFMALDLGTDAFDVVVSLEVLSHVADQEAFVGKLASLLRPGGRLMLATQNRPALEMNDIPEPKPGQIRNWVDRHRLRELLNETFEIEEMFSITPEFNRGPRWLLTKLARSRKVNALLAPVGLDAATRWVLDRQARRWLGFTLMVKARKR